MELTDLVDEIKKLASNRGNWGAVYDHIKSINEGKHVDICIKELHRCLHDLSIRRYYLVESGPLLPLVMSAIHGVKNKIKIVCFSEDKKLADLLFVVILRKINMNIDSQCRYWKKRLMDIRFKYKVVDYVPVHFNSKLMNKYLRRCLELGLYSFGKRFSGLSLSHFTNIAMLIARNNKNEAIRAVKDRIVDPHDFLDNIMCDSNSLAVKNSNIRLLKVCLKPKYKYVNGVMRECIIVTPVLIDAYCCVKFGTHIKTSNGQSLATLVYKTHSNYRFNIMILHRRYRGIDNKIKPRNKVLYKILNTVGSLISRKNLNKLALYYI
jgi:hypothetical protein